VWVATSLVPSLTRLAGATHLRRSAGAPPGLPQDARRHARSGSDPTQGCRACRSDADRAGRPLRPCPTGEPPPSPTNSADGPRPVGRGDRHRGIPWVHLRARGPHPDPGGRRSISTAAAVDEPVPDRWISGRGCGSSPRQDTDPATRQLKIIDRRRIRQGSNNSIPPVKRAFVGSHRTWPFLTDDVLDLSHRTDPREGCPFQLITAPSHRSSTDLANSQSVGPAGGRYAWYDVLARVRHLGLAGTFSLDHGFGRLDASSAADLPRK